MKSIFRYINKFDQPVDFIIEPWAEEYVILPNQELTIIGAYKDSETSCEFEYKKDCIVFYAWEHSLVRIHIEGVDETRSSGSVMF